MNTEVLTEKARHIRGDIVKMLYTAQSGHPGGSLSCVEILLSLYYRVANVDAQNPKMENRDRIVLSKGHACPALYAVLADKGYFPRSDLWRLRQIDSHLQGHPDNTKTPGVDVNTGSLGQGMSVAMGIAIAARHQKAQYRVFTIIGDGETQEGLIWEAAMAAAHYKLDNFTVILDYNGLQIDGSNDEVMGIRDIVKKFEAFGFECYKVDGHDVDAITEVLQKPVVGRPKFVCCLTAKGRGVSFMEDKFGWHGKAPAEIEYLDAMKELGIDIND
ncbi:MAG: transketolase [Oscillospiraceae bacterium]|nr:transketolase [Oscillospiraceae bacterium]MDD3833041.1 transketolase [Oscillospiraceae bacterium]MDD4546435.1 transketolase [Oscillospiraceae bacterium]